METWEDFQTIRDIEIMQDCWRVVFGGDWKKNERLARRGLVMLSNIVRHGEPKLGRYII